GPRVGEGAAGVPPRVRRRPQGDGADGQRAGAGLHARRAAQGAAGAALDAVPPAAEPERGVLGGADVEGGGGVRDREGPLPRRADAADERARGRRAGVARRRREAARDAAPGGEVWRPAGIDLLAELTTPG